MTELLYQTDSYCREFTAVVTGIDADQNGVYLDRTAFYPGGGGQPNDVGQLIAGDKVYPVTKAGRSNVHIIDGELPAVGTPVKGLIDWNRR